MRVLCLGLLLLLPAAVLAQTRPDFSGRWSRMSEPGVFPLTGGPGTFMALGSDFTITMEDPNHFILQLVNQGPWRVRLDGEPTRHVATRGDGRRVETVVTTTWEGDRLVIRLQGTVTRHGKTVPFTKDYRFTATADHTLTVESPDGDGGQLLAWTYRWLKPM